VHYSRITSATSSASDVQGLPFTVDLLGDLIDEAPAFRRVFGNGARSAVIPGLEEEQAVVFEYK